MTYKELINEVLIRLREDTIPDTAWSSSENLNDAAGVSDYQKMIGALVNDTKSNVESYHDWSVLEEVRACPLTTSGTTVPLTDIDYFTKIISVIRYTTGEELQRIKRPIDEASLYAKGSYPTEYSVSIGTVTSFLGSGYTRLEMYTYPNVTDITASDFLQVKGIQPQAKLERKDDILLVPTQPVILGTWVRAISERGEDGGSQTGVVALEYKESLNQAIIRDDANNDSDNDWYVV